jgi:hypothetical protein
MHRVVYVVKWGEGEHCQTLDDPPPRMHQVAVVVRQGEHQHQLEMVEPQHQLEMVEHQHQWEMVEHQQTHCGHLHCWNGARFSTEGCIAREF